MDITSMISCIALCGNKIYRQDKNIGWKKSFVASTFKLLFNQSQLLTILCVQLQPMFFIAMQRMQRMNMTSKVTINNTSMGVEEGKLIKFLFLNFTYFFCVFLFLSFQNYNFIQLKTYKKRMDKRTSDLTSTVTTTIISLLRLFLRKKHQRRSSLHDMTNLNRMVRIIGWECWKWRICVKSFLKYWSNMLN